MIPLAEITGEKNSDAQTKYNRRIPLSQIVADTAPQAEPEETGGFWDTAGNAFDWWKNNSLAGAGFLGGLLAETTGNVAERLGKEFPENSWRRNLLESAGNLAQDAADTMLDYGTKKVYTANGDNFSGAVANQLMSGLTGSYSGLASMIHADKSADALMKARQATENKTPVSTDDLGEYFTNPHGFASDVGQLGGSMAAIAPFMGLAPIGAVTRGVATFGGDAITQALINRGLYGAAKIFAGGAPRAVQYGLTSAPVEGAMEGGETRRELLNRGASEEEATKESFVTGLKNVPLLLATNTLEGLAFFSPLKVSNKALQIAGRGAANSAQEQYEEFAQEGIQNAARGEPYSWLPWNGAPNQYEAAERVRYPAALLGGIGGATQAISGTDENQENWKRGDQTSNLTAKQAEVWDAARYASARAKEKFGYDISPELIYKQWAHESGGTNFDSENARYNNNFGGLTQVEPNGEENKQPDGNNYYRHFSNVWEYADAYVDDFIKYYPEISGTKNEREFAGVLKKYGYFGDDLENYVAGMEGIQAPANRTSGNQPRIDFASGLQSAREALDGKQMENGTVGCVEAVTKILSHVHPEFKKMVDDGVVNTVEGENSLHSRLEQMGVEIIPFDESKVAQGDIIFYDGKQTYQHVLVADHKDADGNWRVFGNSSSANKVMEQPLYQGQTPAWIAKVSNLSGSNTQPQSQTQQKETPQEEPTKPLFDLNAQDSTTQKLLEQFANERFEAAIKDEDAEAANFFNGMFTDIDKVSKFQDTPENRQAIATRYGDELNAFVQKNSQTEPQAPAQDKTSEPKGNAKQERAYDRNTAIIQTGRKYLDELLKKGDEPSRETAWSLNSAIQSNNLAKVENILKQNNVAIPEQNQPQPVEGNEPPENILPQKLSPNDKKIKVASAPVKTGNKGKKSRQKQGSALIDLAAQNGIEIPNAEVIALKQGSTKAVQKWRDNLMKTGVFNTTAEQSQTKPVSGETIERKDANGTTIFTLPNYQPPKPSLKERAKSIIERFKAQQNLEREADLTNEDDDDEAFHFDYSDYVNDDKAPTPTELRQQENEKIIQRYQSQQRKKAEFDEAVKKDSENNYGARADLARQRRERYETTRVDPITARGNFISDVREDEEFLREEDRRENEEAQQVSADTIRANYQNAQRKVQKLKDDVENPITDREYFQKLSESDAREDEEIKNFLRREEDRNEALEAEKQSPEKIRENFSLSQYLSDADTIERLAKLREEGRKQRDREIEELKSANRNAKITAGKEILRTLRSPKYSEVKAKVEATSGLAKALENGSVEAIRQVRNFIAEVDDKALQETQARQAQARAAQEQRITQIRADRRRSGTQIAQADEQARQAQEEYRRRQAAQSRQAGEQAQLGLGQAQANDFQQQRTAQRQADQRYRRTQTAQADAQALQAQEQYQQKVAAQSRQATEQAQLGLGQAQSQSMQRQIQTPPTQEQPASQTKRSEKAQKLHAKYKTDTHPLIKTHLDKVLERAKSKENTPERTAALKELKLYEKRDVTDEWLNETEAKLQKRENELDNQSDTEPTEQEDSVAPSGRKRNSNEIFTSPEGVARILDSAEEETPDMFTNPALTYLDPAAGEGAITTAVLQRKLNSQARKTSGTTNSQLQRNMLKALSSVYSVELHADNVAELKKNMQKVFLDHYREQTGEELNKDSPLFKKMQEIIDANNIQGDYLELTEGNAEKLDEAFREWSDEDLALNDVATKPEVEPTQTKSGQEVSEAPKPKRKAKGKWHTVGSSPSRAELQKLIREFYVNDKMVIEDDGTIRNGKTGKTTGYVVRVANNGRWQFGYYETAEQAESKQEPAEQKETEKFFEQFEATDKQGNKIFVAKIKHGQFPEPEVFDKSVELIDKLDEMAKAHGGRYGGFYHERGDGHEYHFKTTEARDKFVLSIMNDGFLEAELNRQQKTIQDGIKTKQAEIEKIINDAKEDAYKILEADKYPEIKNFINREIGNQADTIIETGDIKKAREFADRLVKNVKSYKDEGKLANGVLVEILNKWETEKRGANRRLSGKLSDKYHKATDIVNEYIEKYKKGEVSLEDAREDLKHFLKTGRRKTKTKFSKQGTVDTRIDNFVDDKDLTPQQKLLKSFGEKLGTKVIFFRNKDGRFHGVRKNGATYLNVNSNMPLGKVFWHESMHWLKNNNPKLYQQLVKAAGITDEQRQAYLERTERTDLETDEAIDEEIIADQFEDVAKRNGLLQSIAGKNRGLIERVVQWLKDTMNKFIDHFRNPQGKLTTEQATRLADEFGRIAKDLVDPNGQKIFRYNRRTHNIELADGRGLNETLKSIGSKNYSLAGAQDSVAKLDDEYLKNVDDFFHAKTDEQRRSTFRKLQDMVQRAAEEAGFHNAVPEQTVAYKVRTTAAPKKTVKVYKVFTVADDGSPTALFVGGTEKLPQGVWLDAQDAWHFKAKNGKYYVPSTQNPFTKGGKTGTSVEIPDEATRQELIKRGFLPKGSKATKITALAYRPGWHAGTLPFFPQGGVKPKKGTTSAYPNIHRYNQVVFECELAAEKNFTAEAEAQPKARTKDGKLNTREADLQYMPKDGFYYYATNPLTHGNPELGMWAISGSLKINRALTQEECDKILAEHNMAPQEWEQGKLNLADLGYTGEQNDAARKTLAPITYDDNGEVIPLSQRFDASKDDIRYSIGRSDNSSESLSQKIQNKFAAWWNGDAKKNRNKEITDLLYRTTGYKVDFGNVKDADQTIIDDVHKVIRTKHAYEWEKLLPQIGGKIAKSLKLNPTQEMSNYIADWCLTGAVGNNSAEAKAFEKAMRDDPVTAGLMLQIRDAFQEFHDMTAQEKIGDTLVSRLQGKSPREIAKTLWSEKEEQLTDDLHPVLRQINEMIAKAEKTSPTLAKMMKEDINPYQMMRLLRGVGGLGELMLHSNAENIEDVRNLLGTLYPRLKFDRLNSLDMIVDMAGGKEHVDGLMKFAVAKLDKEMHEKLREDPDADLRPQFSEAVDDEVIQAGEKQYSAAHRALITYSNIWACIQHDAGLITDSEFGKLMRGWKNYVPMIRVFEDGEEFKLADSLKPKTGSKRNTYNIWETLTQNTYATLSRAERNKAIQQLAFYARIGEFGDIVQEVETSNPGKNIIHFRENGEIKYLKVFDPAVVRAVENIYSPADTAWIMKFLKATMGFVRAMRTLASADFAIGNPFRDMQDAYIHNRHADANPFVALLNAFREGFKGFGFKRMFKEKSLVPHDTDWAEFNALGGTQSTFVSEDVDQLRRSMNKIYRKTKSERFNPFKSGFVGAFKNILDSMQWLSEQTEYMTRLNSYKRAKAELARQRADGKATLEDKKLAALEARDASIDFAKAGTSTRKFNRLVMFANAQVQDWAKWGVIGRDFFKGGEARKVALQKIGRLMLTGVLATIAQAALNYSDDDRREKYKKRPDWEKETYWIFADGLRIPKGQDIGTRFVSALTDEFIGKAMDDDPVSTKRLFKVVRDAIPSIIPSLIEPAYEVHMNYSSFRDAPIVPVGQQNLDKAEQYGKNTSSFAKLFGELTGWISPRGVDYLISGYLGSTGKFLTRLPDYFTRGGTVDDVLMLRRFVFDPAENPKTVKDYYEAYNEQYKHYNTYKLQRKWDKNAQPPDGYDPKLYARLKSVSSTLRKISAAENNILRNPNLDWDTKNEKLRELEKKRERLCQRAMQQAH